MIFTLIAIALFVAYFSRKEIVVVSDGEVVVHHKCWHFLSLPNYALEADKNAYWSLEVYGLKKVVVRLNKLPGFESARLVVGKTTYEI